MIGFNIPNLIQAATTNPEFNTLAALLCIIADPALHQQRLVDLATLIADQNKAKADANDAIAKLASETSQAHDAIQLEKVALAKEVEMRRAEIDGALNEFHQREDAANLREVELRTLEKN